MAVADVEMILCFLRRKRVDLVDLVFREAAVDYPIAGELHEPLIGLEGLLVADVDVVFHVHVEMNGPGWSSGGLRGMAFKLFRGGAQVFRRIFTHELCKPYLASASLHFFRQGILAMLGQAWRKTGPHRDTQSQCLEQEHDKPFRHHLDRKLRLVYWYEAITKANFAFLCGAVLSAFVLFGVGEGAAMPFLLVRRGRTVIIVGVMVGLC